jgi:TPR repeat protein
MKSILTAFLSVCFCLPLVWGEESAKEIFEATKVKAEKGDAQAQSELGLMYTYGEGVLKDYKEAVK